jgi:chemotaxis signal transduction protein
VTPTAVRAQSRAPSEEVARVLARRAERLRAVPVVSEEAALWLAQFPLAGEAYALPLERLRGAIPLRLVRSVPLCPSHVLGTLMFQGELIVALRLASLVGAQGGHRAPATLLVVELGHGHLCAIDCEAIPRPTTVPRKAFDAAEARAAKTGVAELATEGRTSIVLIDLPRLVAMAGGYRP